MLLAAARLPSCAAWLGPLSEPGMAQHVRVERLAAVANALVLPSRWVTWEVHVLVVAQEVQRRTRGKLTQNLTRMFSNHGASAGEGHVVKEGEVQLLQHEREH